MGRKGMRNGIADISITKCLFLIISGLIMGSCFLFLVPYLNEPIDKEEAMSVSVTFESYRVGRGKRGSIRYVDLDFSDTCKSYTIAGACCNNKLLNDLDELKPGDRVELLVHPKSDDIWQLRHGSDTLLSFKDSLHKIEFNNKGFCAMGLFMYICAAIGFLSLILRYHKHRTSSKLCKK